MIDSMGQIVKLCCNFCFWCWWYADASLWCEGYIHQKSIWLTYMWSL